MKPLTDNIPQPQSTSVDFHRFPSKTITDIHQALASRQLSCRELVKEKLSHLEKNDHNTTNLLLSDYALALADQTDRKIAAGEPIGMLEGIPFGIKDAILLQDTVATGSSGFLRNYVSPYTATSIQKLLDAGAIPVVKENCDCFGHGNTNENSAFGAVGNAYDNERVAGGSSGGSAVNVACNLTVFSIGEDTGGSIRQPAGYNKIYGLKPTYGRVSRYGTMAYSSSTDCIGPFASSLEDIRLVINTMSGKDRRDNTTYQSEQIPETVFRSDYPDKNLTVGYYKSFVENEYLEAAIGNDFQKMIDRLASKGVTIKPLDFFDVNILVSTYYVLAMAETASNLARLDGSVYGARTKSMSIRDGYMITRSENFTEETKRRIIAGNQVLSRGHDEEIYLKAGMLRNAIVRKFNEDFGNVDIVLSPVSTTLPPKLGSNPDNPLAMYMSDAFTVGFSLGGLPTLTVPYFTPTGIQVTANKNREDMILHFAQSLKDKQ
jgi:aspartyl-tRNA(Asn)/glutamyl-tRNA(Gln) amidotransferase subunit A